jgi:hypothetical protein
MFLSVETILRRRSTGYVKYISGHIPSGLRHESRLCRDLGRKKSLPKPALVNRRQNAKKPDPPVTRIAGGKTLGNEIGNIADEWICPFARAALESLSVEPSGLLHFLGQTRLIVLSVQLQTLDFSLLFAN